MLRVIVEGIKACPALNAHIGFNRKLVRGKVTQFEEINISMPMILNSGEMMTINMHNMHEKSITEMQNAIKDNQRRANNSDMNEVMFEVSLAYVVAGNKMPLTIAFDHRALDMGDVVPFMKKLDEIFENPEILKEWI